MSVQLACRTARSAARLLRTPPIVLYAGLIPSSISTVRSFSAFSRQCMSTTPMSSATVATRHCVVARGHKMRSFHSSQSAAANQVVPFLLADIGEGITECEVIQWFVKPGERVEQFTRICEVQSDKAAVDISSRFDGVITTLHYKVGDIARVGKPLVDIELDQAAVPEPAAPAAAAAAAAAAVPEPAVPAASSHGVQVAATTTVSTSTAEDPDVLTYATPAVRRVAKEHNVDLRLVTGTGPAGRILKGDVLAFVAGEQAAPAPISEPMVTNTPTTNEIVALTPIQKVMFKTMTKSLQIPHFGFSDEIVLDATTAFRASLNAQLKSLPAGSFSFKKVSYMPIFMKALSSALNDFPILNACIIDAESPSQAKLQYRSSHNIEAGKKGAISLADLQGGTITLSNIGNIGGTVLHPVLVSSELCIGAIGKVQRLPRFETAIDPLTGHAIERVVAKEILNVSFNADHRVVDGATVGRFFQLWKMYLEHPSTLSARLK
ncbi:hypothetical protein BSLG_008868 [Batrachochytrium salamandrivorans]|nr:hypothetical protein BSLG_008868 [Batrachochytrium salamandrivorans]